MRWSISFLLILPACALATAQGRESLMSFEGDTLPPNLKLNNAEAWLVDHKGSRAMEVRFDKADWPNISFTAPEGAWNWSAYVGVQVFLYNPGVESISACIRVDNAGADGMRNCNTGSVVVPPGESAALRVCFNTADLPFWGMRGIPVIGPLGMSGIAMDPSKITAFQVFLSRPSKPQTLLVTGAKLFGMESILAKDGVAMPFVDRFGQYMHETWPGKVQSEEDLQQRTRMEGEMLDSMKPPCPVDKYGGWTDGPDLEATGWFRLAKERDCWWLVTPDGHLFISFGMDCVGYGDPTFIEGRDVWFDELPDANAHRFAPLFNEVSGAHSMAEKINGQGRAFSFYRWNLMRRYGDDWENKWRERMEDRLRAWGFNTIGNWSSDAATIGGTMSFVTSAGVSGSRALAGGKGYWGNIVDPFDAGFPGAVEKSITPMMEKFAGNPRCIGFFVDNELGWETIREGVLASPPDQPARMVFIADLTAKYKTIADLNAAWECGAADWDALRVPPATNTACAADLDAFTYKYARLYFDIISAALKKSAPHQLYLGCRFANAPKPVIRACADVADVISINCYRRNPWDSLIEMGMKDIDKPVIIGEFHFGAMDRGMFHPGLVPTMDQKERAECLALYIRGIANHSQLIGCHWFQYVDEPITGRWYDGENYNIGFVDVTDTPYPEMAAAARAEQSRNAYGMRYNGCIMGPGDQ